MENAPRNKMMRTAADLTGNITPLRHTTHQKKETKMESQQPNIGRILRYLGTATICGIFALVMGTQSAEYWNGTHSSLQSQHPNAFVAALLAIRFLLVLLHDTLGSTAAAGLFAAGCLAYTYFFVREVGYARTN
jgi:hypothetical protein